MITYKNHKLLVNGHNIKSSKNYSKIDELIIYVIDKHNTGRWTELEDLLIKLKNSFDIYQYTRYVIKGRWKEGEKILKDNILNNYDDIDWAIAYAVDVICGKWTDIEPLVVKKPDAALAYIRLVCK